MNNRGDDGSAKNTCQRKGNFVHCWIRCIDKEECCQDSDESNDADTIDEILTFARYFNPKVLWNPAHRKSSAEKKSDAMGICSEIDVANF